MKNIKHFSEFLFEGASEPATTKPIEPQALTNAIKSNWAPDMAKNIHQPILDKIKKNGLIYKKDFPLLQSKVNSPDFLSHLSLTLKQNQVNPLLNIVGTKDLNDTTANAMFKIPLKNGEELSFDLGSDYLGAEIPFLMNTSLSLGLNLDDSTDLEDALKPSGKYSLGINIPIGR
jgi:hypothetical protein